MNNLKYKYIIVWCRELEEQDECDAYREIICLTNNYEPYKQFGYEIYKIKENGSTVLIKNYNLRDRIYDDDNGHGD